MQEAADTGGMNRKAAFGERRGQPMQRHVGIAGDLAKHEQPMIERYWRSVGGALFLEFPLVKRSTDSGPRWLDEARS